MTEQSILFNNKLFKCRNLSKPIKVIIIPYVSSAPGKIHLYSHFIPSGLVPSIGTEARPQDEEGSRPGRG